MVPLLNERTCFFRLIFLHWPGIQRQICFDACRWFCSFHRTVFTHRRLSPPGDGQDCQGPHRTNQPWRLVSPWRQKKNGGILGGWKMIHFPFKHEIQQIWFLKGIILPMRRKNERHGIFFSPAELVDHCLDVPGSL